MKKFMRYYLTFMVLVASLQRTVFATNPTTSAGTISGKVSQILNALAWFGYAIALGMFIYIGIKYAMSAANEKANVKQGLINYLIGAVLIASASVIANVVSVVAAGGVAGGDLAGAIIEAAKEATN